MKFSVTSVLAGVLLLSSQIKSSPIKNSNDSGVENENSENKETTPIQKQKSLLIAESLKSTLISSLSDSSIKHISYDEFDNILAELEILLEQDKFVDDFSINPLMDYGDGEDIDLDDVFPGYTLGFDLTEQEKLVDMNNLNMEDIEESETLNETKSDNNKPAC